MSAYMSQVFKKQLLTICKELHSIVQNWYDLMAFIMYRLGMGREIYCAGDLSKLVSQRINSYVQTPQTRNKDTGSGRAPKLLTKTTFTTKSETKV